MTSAPASSQTMSYEEYRVFENASETKHEWIDGVVYAMSGGSLAHSQLCAQMIGELLRVVEERPCRVLTSDQRTRPERVRFATYPDVAVVCGRPVMHPEDGYALTNPVVLVEVLSPRTESWDRTGKFRRYRRIESLRHYVLVSQHECCIEVYTRNDDGGWTLREAEAGQSIALDALGGRIEVDRVYRDVELTPAPDEREG